MNKFDIQNRADLELLVDTFYQKVKVDNTIGPMFGHVNWESHLPIMYDFWGNVLFYTGNYSGNPMAKHVNVHQKTPMTKDHFAIWLHYFEQTVDELFQGQNAMMIKTRAKSIATIMEMKVLS